MINYFCAAMAALQFVTLMMVLAIPTQKQEFVCRGVIENPDIVRCYEQ